MEEGKRKETIIHHLPCVQCALGHCGHDDRSVRSFGPQTLMENLFCPRHWGQSMITEASLIFERRLQPVGRHEPPRYWGKGKHQQGHRVRGHVWFLACRALVSPGFDFESRSQSLAILVFNPRSAA